MTIDTDRIARELEYVVRRVRSLPKNQLAALRDEYGFTESDGVVVLLNMHLQPDLAGRSPRECIEQGDLVEVLDWLDTYVMPWCPVCAARAEAAAVLHPSVVQDIGQTKLQVLTGGKP
jgi:hypothetical protein